MLPTVSVTCESFDQNGNPIAGARFEAKLDRTEIYDGFVVPEKVAAIADTNGVCVLELWPNALGTNASSYQIKAWNPDTGKRFIDTTAVVPNSDCRLEQIIVAEPYPALDAAQQALIAAQGALASVTAQAQAAAASALVAQDAEDGALAAETAAQASAAAALASQQAAAISQTSASSSATTATGAASTATEAADAAEAARDAAQASASTAATQATAASQSAQAADASADAAAASEAAAAGSASTAQAQATAAAGSANTAQTEAAAALQAKAAAQTAASSAQASAQQAEDAADTATGQAALAAAAVPTALGHANTAASHAATATTKAGEASASQTAAAASQAAAAASQSQASASASAAAVSASTAAVSAAQASVSADSAISLFGSLVDVQAAADEAQAYATAAEVAVSNAQAQASLAAGYAASASSVVQQDLSGVNAAALHRSPNAVTALFVYDTSKDSDGGAWTEKCQHTSWYNEAINGKWLGAQASETAARAVSGAATGDYFQLSTDGAFYRLNAGSGVTGVFRGNKRDFPRLAAIVAEAANVTIYDLTEPGRPMWMRMVGTSVSPGLDWYRSGRNITAIAASNGFVCFSNGTDGYGGLSFADFGKDRVGRYTSVATNGGVGQSIALRHTAIALIPSSLPTIVSHVANAVAMTVLPDAPVDPVTGLKVPTIAVATGGGVSVIKHNGTVVNSGETAAFGSVTVVGRRLFAKRNSSPWAFDFGDISALGAGFVVSRLYEPNSAPSVNTSEQSTPTASTAIKTTYLVAPNHSAQPNTVNLLRANPAVSNNGLAAQVRAAFNTGWQLGQIRRTYLADVDAGSVSGPELVTNGAFDTDTSWSKGSGWSISGGVASKPLGTGSNLGQTLSLVSGKQYEVVVNYTYTNTDTSTIAYIRLGGVSGQVGVGGSIQNVATTLRFVMTAVGTLFEFVALSNFSGSIDNISVKEVVADRSYKAKGASITGTLTKTAVASAAQLVAYSGFSAANYLREPYSADLDFGTGEWTCSAWLNVPVTLPVASFPPTGTDFAASLPTPGIVDGVGSVGAWDGATKTMSNTVTGGSPTYPRFRFYLGLSAGTRYVVKGKLTGDISAVSGIRLATSGSSNGVEYNASTGDFEAIQVSAADLLEIQLDGTLAAPKSVTISQISVREAGPALIADRSYSSGAYIRLGVTYGGQLTATAFDGTTTRTVTTTAAYNTATWLKARANYRAGRLSIVVNGVEVAVTNGAPLLTLNNANAVLTIGNSFALDAPFPGSIALLKFSATVPTAEQSVWMYEQEKQMFREGAQVCLPDAGAIVDLTYDDATDKWIAVSAANESEWSGLVRTSVTPVPAGSYTRAAASSGVQLLARSTTSPGVDVTIPAYGLREELVKRAEAAARINQDVVVFDFDTIGFTAAMTSGSNQVTASSITGTPFVGMAITGTGIPANTTITGINGTTYTLSANATATGSNAVGQAGFDLPVGYTARVVYSAGAQRREGSTRDYTRLFDGFREQVRFAVTPGASTWVQIHAVKEAA